MNKLISTLCASALSAAMAVTTFASVQAAPIAVPSVPMTSAATDVVQANGQDWRWRNGVRRNDGGRNMGFYRGGNDGGYYRGRHNGYRDNYRYNRGRNLGGAIIGGVITGAIVGSVLNNGRVYRGGDSHVQWCYDRYRTYRASDNTYVPRVGVRAYCNSPYN